LAALGAVRHQVAFNLLQAAALGLRHFPPEVGQRHQREEAEQEERADPADRAEQVRKETVTTKLAAQLAMDATLIAAPRILSG
jgi:hypothetical protein